MTNKYLEKIAQSYDVRHLVGDYDLSYRELSEASRTYHTAHPETPSQGKAVKDGLWAGLGGAVLGAGMARVAKTGIIGPAAAIGVPLGYLAYSVKKKGTDAAFNRHRDNAIVDLATQKRYGTTDPDEIFNRQWGEFQGKK